LDSVYFLRYPVAGPGGIARPLGGFGRTPLQLATPLQILLYFALFPIKLVLLPVLFAAGIVWLLAVPVLAGAAGIVLLFSTKNPLYFLWLAVLPYWALLELWHRTVCAVPLDRLVLRFLSRWTRRRD
jgi:hypothetical protein